MTESSPQNCSTVVVAVNTLLVSLTLRFIAARQIARIEAEYFNKDIIGGISIVTRGQSSSFSEHV